MDTRMDTQAQNGYRTEENRKPQPRAFPRGYIGAGDEIRTRDQELGKLLLYQLSYARLAA